MAEGLRLRYERISSLLAARSDIEIIEHLGGADPAGPVVLDIDDVAVFAKRVPLTDRELDRPLSTANLYELPTFCQYVFGMPRFTQYGFGGPALNGWRELAANRIITQAALSGRAAPFPLLYHWRVLPIRPPITATSTDVDAVVGALDGATGVRERLDGLRAATHSLVLFFENVPDPVSGWISADPVGRAARFEAQLLEAVRSLQALELLHMDVNFDNMRADGQRIHLVDFGLAISRRFDLSPAERDFVNRNARHDVHYASMRLAHWAATSMCGVGSRTARTEFIRRCAEREIPDGLPPPAAGILTRHAAVAHRMNRFYRRLFDGDRNAEYPAGLPCG